MVTWWLSEKLDLMPQWWLELLSIQMWNQDTDYILRFLEDDLTPESYGQRSIGG